MQFTIARDAVLATISHVARRTKRGSIPILEHILLVAKDKSVSLGGHDGHASSSGDIPADVSEAGECVVPGEQFLSIIDRTPKGSHVKVKFDQAETQAEVSCGRSRYRLSTLPVSDFPPLLTPENPVTLHLSGDDIDTLFGAPGLVIEEDNAHLNFCGLYFHGDADGKVAGCGASKALLIKVATSTKFPKKASPILIPKRSIDDIRKTAGEHGADFSWSDKILQVKSGDWTYATKLIDAQFPDYFKFVPKANGHYLKVETENLRGAIHRLQAIEATRSYVRLRWEDGASEISAHLNGNGEGGEYLECEGVDMKAGTIAVSASDLMNIVTALDGKTLTMHITSPTQAFRVSSDELPDMVVMQAPIHANT